jgi:hypothetical protein
VPVATDDDADVRLTIRALPDAEVPAAVRLRRWLKLGLRSFRLRCTEIEGLAGKTECSLDDLDNAQMGE